MSITGTCELKLRSQLKNVIKSLLDGPKLGIINGLLQTGMGLSRHAEIRGYSSSTLYYPSHAEKNGYSSSTLNYPSHAEISGYSSSALNYPSNAEICDTAVRHSIIRATQRKAIQQFNT
ncbi:hypothetical protein DPMN_088824 [Dreissena polymorpha]|uniref:Uncharacterized protein n=1 Tax=Dreissena polymorpha TaxID=45954 RepID=A0A9D4KWK4_DREPO|nr:hypothetical protein DPMN_088824 [Dreissena polymorpha]